MNRRVPLAPPLAALSVLFAACSSPPAQTAATAEVEAAHLKAIGAFNACNQEAFLATYSDNFTFTTSNTRAAFVTRDALSGYLTAACRQKPSPQITLKAQKVRFVGQTAVLSGQYSFRVVSQGASSDITQNFTAVVQRESDGWRVLAHHVSVSP